jgi:hypothetical protein
MRVVLVVMIVALATIALATIEIEIALFLALLLIACCVIQHRHCHHRHCHGCDDPAVADVFSSFFIVDTVHQFCNMQSAIHRLIDPRRQD